MAQEVEVKFIISASGTASKKKAIGAFRRFVKSLDTIEGSIVVSGVSYDVAEIEQPIAEVDEPEEVEPPAEEEGEAEQLPAEEGPPEATQLPAGEVESEAETKPGPKSGGKSK